MAKIDAIATTDRCETVKVKHPKGGYMIINKDEHDEKLHGPELKDEPSDDDEEEDLDGINASGTLDEPTPTNVQFGNKDETEHENNHVSGQSAAELRKGKQARKVLKKAADKKVDDKKK